MRVNRGREGIVFTYLQNRTLCGVSITWKFQVVSVQFSTLDLKGREEFSSCFQCCSLSAVARRSPSVKQEKI